MAQCQAWDIGYDATCTNDARWQANKHQALPFVLCGQHLGRAKRSHYEVAPLDSTQAANEERPDWAEGRDRCPECGTWISVTKAGAFRKHKRIQEGRFHMVHCAGSGVATKSQ